MSVEQLKNQIVEKISEIENLDLSKLYPSGPNVGLWNNITNSELKKYVDSTIELIHELKSNINLLDSIGFNSTQNLLNHLTNFVAQFAPLNDLNKNQITTHHHNSLNQLHGLNSIFRSTGLYSDISVRPNINEKLAAFKEVEGLMDRLVKNKSDLSEAIKQGKEWLKNKNEIDEQTMKGQAEAFLDRAKEHKKGRWVSFNIPWFEVKIPIPIPDFWLVGALLSSAAVAYVTYTFFEIAKTEGENVYVGQSLLRISALIVPAYLTVFFANQYLYHKKM